MGTIREDLPGHPAGEQPTVERILEEPVVADTFAGRIHVEWDAGAPVTPFGQLPFFIEFLKQGGLFDGWVAGCPLHYTSPNAPSKRNLLGTVLLSVLAGGRRSPYHEACDATRLIRPCWDGASAERGRGAGSTRSKSRQG